MGKLLLIVAVAGMVGSAAVAQDFDLFALADTNTDGKVTMEEATAFSQAGWDWMSNGAAKVAKTDVPEMMQPSFSTAAVDGQGNITKDAFMATVGPRFGKADKNGDKTLDRAELEMFVSI